MNEQFESLKRAFAKQIKEHGYTKTTEDLKKHCEKLKQALREARHEYTIENRKARCKAYNRAYYTKHSAEINAKKVKARLSWTEEEWEQHRSRCRAYYHEVQKKRRQKNRIEQLEAKLKTLKEEKNAEGEK